jgi:hypothetical protein
MVIALGVKAIAGIMRREIWRRWNIKKRNLKTITSN